MSPGGNPNEGLPQDTLPQLASWQSLSTTQAWDPSGEIHRITHQSSLQTGGQGLGVLWEAGDEHRWCTGLAGGVYRQNQTQKEGRI